MNAELGGHGPVLLRTTTKIVSAMTDAVAHACVVTTIPGLYSRGMMTSSGKILGLTLHQ